MSPELLLRQSENYYIQAVTDVRELPALAQDWSVVADCYRGYHPFLCHDWYGTWLEHFLDHGGRLFILILRQKGTDRPLAIFPLLETRARFKQRRATQLELIGNMYSPARFFLVNRDLVSDGQALAAVLNFLRSRRSEWDLLALDALPEELIHFDSIESTIWFSSGNGSTSMLPASAHRMGTGPGPSVSRRITRRERARRSPSSAAH